jgi:hypothetical protein
MPPISAVLLLTAATTAGVLGTLVFYMMIGKVNEKLPEDQKIPYFFSFSYPFLIPIFENQKLYARNTTASTQVENFTSCASYFKSSGWDWR